MIIAPCDFLLSRQWAEDSYNRLIAIFFPSWTADENFNFLTGKLNVDRVSQRAGFTRLIITRCRVSFKPEPKSKIIINGIKVMAVKCRTPFVIIFTAVMPFFPHLPYSPPE